MAWVMIRTADLRARLPDWCSQRELGLHDLGEPGRDAYGLLAGRRLNHDAHDRLRAGLTQQHPTEPGEFLLLLHHGSLDHLVVVDGVLVDSPDIEEELGQPRHDRCQLPQATAALSHPSGEEKTGEGAVAGGGVVEQNDVTGLLAAKRV